MLKVRTIGFQYLGEVLQCFREIDPYAVKVMKPGTRAGTMVGHLPKKTSSTCSLFIRKGGTIDCKVTDPNRKYSRDLPQRSLEIPYVFTLRGTKDLVDKAVKLLAISIFCKKYFRNLHVIMKITKILYYENLEPYGNRPIPNYKLNLLARS